MTQQEVMEKLQAPFPPEEVEWRVQSCGLSSNGNPWVKVICYIQARAIQRRLESVFGWDGWADEYRVIDKNIICRLGVKTESGWIYKENGATTTDIESFKGGISGAFKRVAASGFGIGRYLYELEEQFSKCQIAKPTNTNGWDITKTKDKKTSIYWEIPKLPAWALPQGYKQAEPPKAASTPEPHKEPPKQDIYTCELCNKSITQGINVLSKKKYSKSLCQDCQKKAVSA